MEGEEFPNRLADNGYLTMATAFLITKDFISDVADREDTMVGTYGPSRAPQDMMDALANGKTGRAFRVQDDDGEIYFSGRILTTDGTPSFAPLDCVGKAWGCTEIRYMENHRWLSLG
jgi:hypothetical protein